MSRWLIRVRDAAWDQERKNEAEARGRGQREWELEKAELLKEIFDLESQLAAAREVSRGARGGGGGREEKMMGGEMGKEEEEEGASVESYRGPLKI